MGLSGWVQLGSRTPPPVFWTCGSRAPPSELVTMLRIELVAPHQPSGAHVREKHMVENHRRDENQLSSAASGMTASRYYRLGWDVGKFLATVFSSQA